MAAAYVAVGIACVPSIGAPILQEQKTAKVITRKLPADHPIFQGGPTMFTPISRPRPPKWSVVVSDNWSMYADDDAPDAAGEFASAEADIGLS